MKAHCSDRKDKIMWGKRRIIAGLLAGLMLVCPMFPAHAEEDGMADNDAGVSTEDATSDSAAADGEEKSPEEIAAEEEAARKQASYDTPADSNSLENWPAGPNVYAASAIVMDMDSGAVLYSKKSDEQHYPASITKLLTVLVALENADLTDTITFSQESIDILSWDDANIAMKPGEQISLNDALYAVLLASANEVSYAVAENVGNTMGVGYQGFIDRMNERAAELGCTGSHWVNANGLHDEQHYTTAYDMALIASAVYQQEQFRTIMGTLEYRIGKTAMTDEERVFQQNHKMLWPENYYYYEYCTGGKTGYTDQSGTTLVTMADNGTMRLAAVVLADYGVDAYDDTRAMMDYAFANFTKVKLEEQNLPEDIESYSDPEAYVVLPAGVEFSDLDLEIQESAETQENTAMEDSAAGLSTVAGTGVSGAGEENTVGEDSRLATVVYTYQGQQVGQAEVTLSDLYYEKKAEAGNSTEQETADTAGDETETTSSDMSMGTALAIAAAIAVVAALILWGLVRRKRKALAKKRRRQRKRDRRRR